MESYFNAVKLVFEGVFLACGWMIAFIFLFQLIVRFADWYWRKEKNNRGT